MCIRDRVTVLAVRAEHPVKGRVSRQAAPDQGDPLGGVGLQRRLGEHPDQLGVCLLYTSRCV